MPERLKGIPSTGSKNATIAGAHSIIDWETLRARFNDNNAFIDKLVAMALASYQAVPEKLRNAVEQKDLNAMVFIAHSVRGTSGNLQAHALCEIATRVEDAARSGRSDTFELADQLTLAVTDVIAVLSSPRH